MALRTSIRPDTEYERILYDEQQTLINQVAYDLEVIAYRPSYHHDKVDANTVMIYFKADDDYNNEIDKKYSALSQETLNGMYRRPFFTFENTDCNGLFSYKWGNHGKIDLRSLKWKDRLSGAIKLAYYQKLQERYVLACGGYGGIREADDRYNDLNRWQIEQFLKYHGTAYMCSANYSGERRKGIVDGTQSVYDEYTGQKVYNFGCTYLVPEKDAELEEIIREWNRDGTLPKKYSGADAILKRVEEIGGIYFIWY